MIYWIRDSSSENYKFYYNDETNEITNVQPAAGIKIVKSFEMLKKHYGLILLHGDEFYYIGTIAGKHIFLSPYNSEDFILVDEYSSDVSYTDVNLKIIDEL